MSSDPVDLRDDLRQRMSSLAKALLVLDGGALAISVMIFLGGVAPDLLAPEILLLRLAWWILSGSLAASASLLFAMLFDRGRRLRFGLGLVAFVAFLLGFALLVAVCASVLGVNAEDYASAALWRSS
ncbi:MAG TPA: hypothetical protein VGI18_09235 [Burkholderiales bacterium]|jgi:hypothetical protein